MEELKKIQVILALLQTSNEGIKNEQLARLITNNFSKEIIDKLISYLSTKSKDEVHENLEVNPALDEVERNGLKLDFDRLERTYTQKLKDDLEVLIKDPRFLNIVGKVGSFQWLKELSRANNYNINSFEDLDKDSYEDDVFIQKIKSVISIRNKLNCYDKIKDSSENGSIHTTYIPYQGLSGRIISHSPSIQNLPGYWKDYILPLREGEKVFELDIISAEIFALAWLAMEYKVYEILSKGNDFYTYVASKIFELEESKVSKELRKLIKIIINGITYGMGENTIADCFNKSGVSKFKISPDQGKLIKDKYFELFPKFREYQDTQKITTTLSTALGHKFSVQANYKNIAFGPQNLIATLMKKILKSLHENNLTKHVINIVHDSLWLSCKEEEMVQIKEIMELNLSELTLETKCEGLELIKINELGGIN